MNNTLHPVQWLAFSLLSLVLLVYILSAASFIFVPLMWAAFFAFALYPITNWLEERRIPRGIAITVTLLVLTSMALGIMYLLFGQMIRLIADIPEIGESLEEKLETYMQQIQSLIGIDLDETGTDWSIYQFFSTDDLNATLFSTGKSLTLAGIIPLYTFLLLYYKDFFVEFVIKASAKSNVQVLSLVSDAGKVIQAYISGMVKVTGIVAVLSGIFFYWMEIEYYLLFAIWIAIMNLIPYIGVFISSSLVILYVFLTTDSLLYPLITFLVLWGIQLVENNLITPVVVGSKVNVNALVVILAILAGGGIWGVSGMVLFIPLVGVMKITFDRIPVLEPYGYLLGDKFPVEEKKENFWKLIVKKIKKQNP